MIEAQKFKDTDSPAHSVHDQFNNINKSENNYFENRSRLYSSVRTTASSAIRSTIDNKIVFTESKSIYQVCLKFSKQVFKSLYFKTLVSGGLFRLYRNCNGNYGKLIAGTIATILRAFEMPFYVLVIRYAYYIFDLHYYYNSV